MSDSRIAFQATDNIEGEYSHDPDDPGGETYRAIARRYNPGWEGWRIIDALKPYADFRARLQGEAARLDPAVRRLFKARYWDVFRADEHACQLISNELYDQEVNLPPGQATRHLQQALNALNRNGSAWPDIPEDGQYGDRTHVMLQQVCSQFRADVPALYKLLNIAQGAYYLARMRDSPVKEKYARGWLRRVEFVRA